MQFHQFIPILFLSLFPLMSATAQVTINELMSTNSSTIQDSNGETNDWIEIFNNQNTSIDLEGYSLTDNSDNSRKWIFPSVDIPANGFILVWASGKNYTAQNGEIHTNFKIDSEGELIQLYSPSQDLLDACPATKLSADLSIGRIPNDISSWYFFDEATPQEANQTTAYSTLSQFPIVSHDGGFYDGPILVKFTPSHPDDEIRFTIDGSIPIANSSLYQNPLSIFENKILRAKVFREGAIPSSVLTNSYLFDDDLNLPVVSLVTEQQNFFGPSGIYDNAQSGKEMPIHLEYFEKDEKLGFKLDMGVKIHSPDASAQKSLRLYARSEYGKKEINYPVFEHSELQTFKRLILRNGGNDSIEKNGIHVKDGFAHTLYKQQDNNYASSAYKPVHVFLNSDYFGIYNLRERQDEHFIKSHYGYDCDEIDFLEYDIAESHGEKTICGDWSDWEALKEFLMNNDIGDPNNYTIVNDWIDIENFIDYQIFEIFIGNQDWLNNNIKFWRPKEANGKWQWVLWDTDYALGNQVNFPVGQPDFDFMHMAMTWGGWGDDDWTWMLRNLMANGGFEKKFILRFADLLNTTFLSDYLLSELEKTVGAILPDLHRQQDRWGATQAEWDEHYTHVRSFVDQRNFFNREHLIKEFELIDTPHTIYLDVSSEKEGNIQVNSIFIDENTLGWQLQAYPWHGEYFENYKIKVTAIAQPGYEFSHWEGDIDSNDSVLDLALSSDLNITAVFAPLGTLPDLPKLELNELMAKNENAYPDESGQFHDWIEIYNYGEQPINLAGLYLTDDLSNPLKYQIPNSNSSLTTVKPDDYITFFADEDLKESELHLDFKLNQSGEQLGLYYLNDDSIVYVIDKVTFPSLDINQSYGRLPTDRTEWGRFDISTPNNFNDFLNKTDEKLNSKLDIELFPNPTDGLVFVRINEAKNAEYQMVFVNALGVPIQEQIISTNTRTILDFSNWPEGLYFMNINSNVISERLTKRFIISR